MTIGAGWVKLLLHHYRRHRYLDLFHLEQQLTPSLEETIHRFPEENLGRCWTYQCDEAFTKLHYSVQENRISGKGQPCWFIKQL